MSCSQFRSAVAARSLTPTLGVRASIGSRSWVVAFAVNQVVDEDLQHNARLAIQCLCDRPPEAVAGPSSSGGHCGLTNLRLRSRAQLGARGRSSALAGWPAFDGPSSAAGLSDRRICAGGLAGFLTGWAGRTFRGSPAAQLISRCGAN